MFLAVFAKTEAERLKRALASNHALIITNRYLGNLELVSQWLSQLPAQQAISLNPDQGKIKIEAIREVISLTTTQHTTQRLFIINQADRMVVPAQNSLLKTLEEPNPNNQFVILTNRLNKLLPTIRSRAAVFQLASPAVKTIKQQLDSDDLDAQSLNQIAFLAGDDFGTWQRLVGDADARQQQISLATQAKFILTADRYQRLVEVRKLAKDRQAAIYLAQIIVKILYVSLKTNHQPAHLRQIETWLDVIDRLEANQAVNVVLTQAVV